MADFLASLSCVLPGLKASKPETRSTPIKAVDLTDLDYFGEDAAKNQGSKVSAKKQVKPKEVAKRTFINTKDLYDSDEQRIVQARIGNSIRVYASDQTELPAPVLEFNDLVRCYDLPDQMVNNIQTGYRFEYLTPIQMQAIPLLMEGHDLIAEAPTGSGKTLAFLIPLICKLRRAMKDGFRALIISPTKELAKQLYSQLIRLTNEEGQGKCFLESCLLTKDMLYGFKSVPSKRFDVLVSTPLLLIKGLKNGSIDIGSVETVILDEADRLLEMGFLAQIDEILSACTSAKIQKALFSATISSGVELMANSFMLSPVKIVVGTKEGASVNVLQELMFVGHDDSGKALMLKQLVVDGKLATPCIVFVRSMDRVSQVANVLGGHFDLPVATIASNTNSNERELAVENFRTGKCWFLVATDLLARGLDFKNVSTVLNYDCPETLATYVHRIGRTGRAGNTGKALTFFTKEDSDYLRTIGNAIRESGSDVPEWIFQLKKVSNSQIKRNKIRQAQTEKWKKHRREKKAGRKTGGEPTHFETSNNDESFEQSDEEIDSDCA